MPSTTPVYDTYWRFAALRQDILHQRVNGRQPPWTDDPILRSFRFTNAYRAADRTSQYLIRHVIYKGDWSAEDTVFRILLFKIFNRIETWESLERDLGPPNLSAFDCREYVRCLNRLFESGRPVYSGAYMMPSVGRMGRRAHKHENHLELLAAMMRDELPKRLQDSRSLRDVYDLLRSYPSIGRFLAYQYAIDLNYSTVVDFSEMSFVVAGPGAVHCVLFEPSTRPHVPVVAAGISQHQGLVAYQLDSGIVPVGMTVVGMTKPRVPDLPQVGLEERLYKSAFSYADLERGFRVLENFVGGQPQHLAGSESLVVREEIPLRILLGDALPLTHTSVEAVIPEYPYQLFFPNLSSYRVQHPTAGAQDSREVLSYGKWGHRFIELVLLLAESRLFAQS